ncbi:MAG: hypothetical protein C4325_06270 [Blastocatellia bacterium]
MRHCSVLVTRPAGHFSEVLTKIGCEVINLELIRTQPIADLAKFVEIIRQIERYDGIFLTSPAAGELFVRQLESEGREFVGPVYVLGDRLRASLADTGLNVISRPAANTAKDLINAIDQREFAGKRFLFIRGNRSVRTIPEMLGGIARIDELVVYETINCSPDGDLIESVKIKLKENEIDWVCFFSPSGVDGFLALFRDGDFGGVKAAAIGETTARQATEAGLKVEFVSNRSTAEDFAADFSAFLKRFE